MNLCRNRRLQTHRWNESGQGLELVPEAEDPERCEIAVHIGGQGNVVYRRRINVVYDRQCYNPAVRYFRCGYFGERTEKHRTWFVVRLCATHCHAYRVDQPFNKDKYQEISREEYEAERNRKREGQAGVLPPGLHHQPGL